MKKGKLKNFLIYLGLTILIIFVVITSIVVNYKQKKLKKTQENLDSLPKTEEVLMLKDIELQ